MWRYLQAFLPTRPSPSPPESCRGFVSLPCTCNEVPSPDALDCTVCSHLAELHRPPPRVRADPFACPRTLTVSTLADLVDDERVVHVCGTPCSGKSTLALLLQDYFKSQGRNAVYIPNWRAGQDYMGMLVQAALSDGYELQRDKLDNADYVFILDEAQMSFNQDGFWLGFVKRQIGRRWGPTLAVFSSYGSPSAGPEDYAPGSPLACLGPQQRVSLTVSNFDWSPKISLFFSREEYEDTVMRLCSDKRKPLVLSQDAIAYIFYLTAGHPGAVDSCVRLLQMEFRADLKHNFIKSVTKKDIITLLIEENKTFSLLNNTPLKRSFVDQGLLSSDAANVLRQTLAEGSIVRDLSNPAIDLCYRRTPTPRFSASILFLGSHALQRMVRNVKCECWSMHEVAEDWSLAIHQTIPPCRVILKVSFQR